MKQSSPRSMKSRRKQGDWLIGFRHEPEKKTVTKTQDWLRPQTLERKPSVVKNLQVSVFMSSANRKTGLLGFIFNLSKPIKAPQGEFLVV